MATSKDFSFALTVVGVIFIAYCAFAVGRHLRHVSSTARPTWPQITAELDGIVASASGDKTSDFRVAKSQSTIFVVDVGFRRPDGPIATADMDRAMGEHGWAVSGSTFGNGRLYCKGDLVATVRGPSKSDGLYLAQVDWGSADGLCGRH
ncbi:hypothetical protein [Dokdonella sp.]|uniref:hypothetical protein n=1 Tax=Dokdonella sp. TaxID=2291710 RepID=UPI001B26A5D2|nr:hypothetical protein [Dokdonella sp.]MBO9662241.1 hypothetical protein [Dokdonella sp.]